MPLEIAIVLGFVYGAVLTFWHRKLMVRLHAAHPDIWQQLGRGLGARLWPLSLRFPIWSWPSMFFFVTKRYERLGDRSFSTEAAKFRVAFIAWLLALASMSAIFMWMDSR
jgi:hypothetical protein